MLLFGSFLILSIAHCCDHYPGIPAVEIEHGKYSFSQPAVRFMEENNVQVGYMSIIEEIIQKNPGVGSIHFGNNCYVSVIGLKGKERHFGCFKDDEKCRITSLFEIPE